MSKPPNLRTAVAQLKIAPRDVEANLARHLDFIEQARAESDEECLLVADLSYEDVSRARFELPTVRDSNLGLIQREIERLAQRLGVPQDFRDL